MLNKYLAQLCDSRQTKVPQALTKEFISLCNQHNIHPSGCAYVNGNIIYRLPNPLTEAEARVIADSHNLAGSFQYLIDRKYSPYSALAELNLI